jgi:hypothetical protein
MMIATRNQVVSGSVESPGHDARPDRVRRGKSRPVALGSHFLARSILSFETLLQAVHIIDAGTDLCEGACIASTRPQAG